LDNQAVIICLNRSYYNDYLRFTPLGRYALGLDASYLALEMEYKVQDIAEKAINTKKRDPMFAGLVYLL
jgi:hypothetical protein